MSLRLDSLQRQGTVVHFHWKRREPKEMFYESCAQPKRLTELWIEIEGEVFETHAHVDEEERLQRCGEGSSRREKGGNRSIRDN